MSHRTPWNYNHRKIDANEARQAYKQFGRVDLAADALGVGAKTLRRRLRELGVHIAKGFRGIHTEETKRRFAVSFKRQYKKENHPKWLGDKLNRTCQQCGATFRLMSRSRERKFCSWDCYSRSLVGPGTQNWQGGISFIEVTCAVCGKKIKRQRTCKYKTFYCCRECMNIGQSGPGSPTWQGGKSRYPGTFTYKLRKLVRDRDGYRCRMCGKTQRKNGRALDVHHIDFNKENLDPENLITLCMSCHARITMKREYHPNNKVG